MPQKPSVAIVGIGAIFPDAPDLKQYWENIRSGRTSAREVPAGRWHVPADSVFDPTPGKADRVYSRRGCFIDQLPSLPELTGIALDPGLVAGLDPLFQLLLHAGKRAFDNGVTAPLDRSRVGVIVGNLALPTQTSAELTRTWLGRTFEEKLLGKSTSTATTDPINRYGAGLPAGLLAHALGLGGGGCTLDAACASSLYAIKLAVDELLSGRADAMLTGGVSRPDPLFTQMGFSQLRALSRRGVCSPFDAAADGLVVGEGAGIFLLKRTQDALAHGDRIYGIIKAVGLSNDVGGSLLAPMSEGQLRAMRAAYDQSGWHPHDVDLIECHATGTAVGDATEFSSLKALWGNTGTMGEPCVIGSVKSNIGHLLTAAGAAALTKVILAINEGVLPPTANFTTPPDAIALTDSPFQVLSSAKPWNRRGEAIPRRAAVSAFGFGGINGHLLIEEFLPEAYATTRAVAVSPVQQPVDIAVVGIDARFGPWQTLKSFTERILGKDDGTEPVKPSRWWGAEKSDWFREEELDRTPFNGYYLDNFTVAGDQFRIPPREMEEMLPQQLLMLQTAAAAMADAGLGREGNDRSAVLIGIALDLNSTNFSFRWSIGEEAKHWQRELGLNLTAEELDVWTTALREAAGPPLTANRTMGALGNIVASRIAREFKVGGPSFTVSNEEGSGIRALEAAIRLLNAGEVDRALVGAVDLAGDLRAVLGHHSRRPFSPDGSGTPFDTNSAGSIVGEGATAVVLKRLEDAKNDGDRIYAVIKGIGTAGDAIVAPGEKAYTLAMERAYRSAGVEPETVSLIEASASGNPADDIMEARTLARFFDKASPRTSGVTSIKGEIGHCGAAAGLASLVRGCLALYHEIIPPNRRVDNPLPELSGNSPLYIPGTPRYWLRNRAEGARRAGVSSVGVDGTCSHVVLEGWEVVPQRFQAERQAPLGSLDEFIFAVTGDNPAELAQGMEQLRLLSESNKFDLPRLALEWQARNIGAARLATTIVARNFDELTALVDQAKTGVTGGNAAPAKVHPLLRDRIFYSSDPIGPQGQIAFIFPGSGNHYAGMAMRLSSAWPEVFRRQDAVNLYLRNQFQPEFFWNSASADQINDNHEAVIFGQVATGVAVSDVVRTFGIEPTSVIGYSLGESAGLFALGAWHARDEMLMRMGQSTLFTRDLAGECRAAAQAWGLGAGKEIEWSIGVVEASAKDVRRALRSTPRAYLLIVNTPDECVIGGDAKAVKRLVAMLECRFHPLHGVTTVHCEVAKHVAEAYRDLHLFDTTAPEGVTFYSGAKGTSYAVTRASAADSILANAVDGIDFPAVINAAYDSGVRYFIEMGPGASCSRMIGRILGDRPHMARSACFSGMDETSGILRLLAQLISERLPVDLAPLYMEQANPLVTVTSGRQLQFNLTNGPFDPPKPARLTKAATAPAPARDVTPPVTMPTEETIASVTSMPVALHVAPKASAPPPPAQIPADPLMHAFAAAQSAQLQAHEAYLKVSNSFSQAMADALSLQFSLQDSLAAAGVVTEPVPVFAPPAPLSPVGPQPTFDRQMCLEFARGLAGRMLGPAFAEADTFPTRVRLPDEPLMLVDRIMSIEGEPKSMTHGRVVTEHDIHPGAWYLDGGRIPTCIAVEAGQADLFLSGYLGIDFITKGLAVYRLLDAVVTFHRQLPVPGETIHYDISIERFFRQGDTYLFRFRFDATVNGQPLLTMRDGCAGFFSAAELAAGKGIVKGALDMRPRSGKRPADWSELVPMARESYDAAQLEQLRKGNLAGCFGPLFNQLAVSKPLTIPGGRMQLVHRVMELDPTGGRYGLGMIRAEADIHPDDWFITCHFVDDRVMPGTLMYECCMHTLRIFLLRMGWVAEAGDAAWEPVPEVASRLCCRGQVLETTKVAGYEITIRELGYRPEPYAIVDALMYADGKAIVEITSMSVRLSGTSKNKLLALWQNVGVPIAVPITEESGHSEQKPAIYTKDQILAYSNGNPSEGFGDKYRIFDHERKIARLPGPPFQFMDRVTAVGGEPWQMVAGAMAEAQYDIPANEWYFKAERQPLMPFCVLLEAALQPCGWLAAYVGSALTSPSDISFRNLGGTAVQHRPVTPQSGTLTAKATMKKVATSGGMIIQEYDFSVSDRHGIIYEGDTMFGFFFKEALATQVGIRDAVIYKPTAEEEGRGTSLVYPETAPFPEKMLRMIDRIELYVADGGPKELGYIRGIKEVDPDEWFFKAHFYQDPVTPGSLGLESFLQLLKYAAVERWGHVAGETVAVIALGQKHSWLYRGQVVPSNNIVTVQAWITAIDDTNRTMTADGFLSVDGKTIYQMNQFTVRHG